MKIKGIFGRYKVLVIDLFCVAHPHRGFGLRGNQNRNTY